MKRFWNHWGNFIILGLIILGVYSPALLTFLAQDDFTHLIISRAGNVGEVINFFKFKTEGIYYRPVSVQLITWLTKGVFGLRPFWFHAAAVLMHFWTTVTVKKIIDKLTGSKDLSWWGAVFYGVHPVHFMSLFWWAEVSMVMAPLFAFLAILAWLNQRYVRFSLWWLLALLSNELALGVIPIVWLLKPAWKRLIPVGLIGLVIVGGRWLLASPALGTEYGLKFLPQVALSNLRWQFIRAAGFPEGFAGQWQFWQTKLAIGFIAGSALIMLTGVIKSGFKLKWAGLGWWLAALLPVVFLERHQSPIYQIIGLPGLVLAISAWLKPNRWQYAGLAMFVAGAFWGVRAMEQYHWVTSRAREAEYYIKKIQGKKVQDGDTIAFVNRTPESSLRAYIALGAGNGVKVFFGNETKVYFEDLGMPNLDPQAKTHYVVSDF
ncbi:MAG: hypothetical protein A2784_03165 [Candidatus Chisholmbacteria bacterium RIFCSPHIGHO2_01_FULL_48_12]|uniref:Glycosyltransferase RgtA/B/C/D-like domain-containing protein n=1 Tax=Candidatus Chisholmbacteria bacterium RIFCSPHIGHO2_01_FULL_48_12 TaxID=1797589 RepID=A0A1G1VJS9_9BACT|nr:MAG: hypothetical protein A2784_03165 [Candidatus Chisholmbacteria bacterium RIFCSPHIGHO2_01_FULL_48_12]